MWSGGRSPRLIAGLLLFRIVVMVNHPNRSRSSPARNPTPAEIRAAREAAGLTQEAAAALVLSARRAWQDWELGARRMHPGLWKLFQIEVAQR